MGGSSNFLYYLLTYLDKEKFEPFVAFYLPNHGAGTEAIRRLSVPVLFLDKNPEPTRFFPFTLLSGNSRSRLSHKIKVILRVALRMLLVEIPQAWRLLWHLRREHISLVVLNNDVHYHVPGVMATKLAKLPCICRKAGGIGEGRRLKSLLVPAVDLFICVSRATQADQLETAPPPKRVEIVYEGVDIKSFDPSPPSPKVRSELHLPAGKKVIGYVSRFDEGKGHAEFLDAAALVVSQYTNVVFLIVGDEVPPTGAFLKKLQAQAHELKLDDHVIFTGWRDDMPETLSVLDIFVHCPTTWIEGLGIAHLEAMAMGKPTVVSDNGGLPDVVLDGVTGFLVPPGNIQELSAAILRLLRDDELARRLGANARQRAVKEFDIEKNTQKLGKLFEEYVVADR
ncbi:MAG: glycosyltransferase family 4 protein [Candidatus Acidiferrum sp.]